MRASTSTLLLRTALVLAALLVVVLLTLSPQRLVGPLRWDFVQWASHVQLPFVAGAGYPATERLFNAVLFAPLGAALAAILPRRAWLLAPLACIALSAAVEYAQARIPGRVPDLDDIVWNAVGGAIAAVMVGLARVALAGARQRGSRART